jgi:hypothetical protein
MSTIEAHCGDKERRRLLRRSDNYNGLDFAEVTDNAAELKVYLFNELVSPLDHAALELFDRCGRPLEISDITVERDRRVVTVTLARDLPPGNYELRVNHAVLPSFDRSFDSTSICNLIVDGADVDCADDGCETAPLRDELEVSYLARDYAALRQVLLDRLAETMPEWRDRHVADFGMMLVELFAYRGDRLSYLQDAVATEAYLNTARKRISVRRHLRLVDYRLHDGCNARAWICITTDEDRTLDADDISFETLPAPRHERSGFVAQRNASDDVRVYLPLMVPDIRVQLVDEDLKYPKKLLYRLEAAMNPAVPSPFRTQAATLAKAIVRNAAAALQQVDAGATDVAREEKDVPSFAHLRELAIKHSSMWPRLFCAAANGALRDWQWDDSDSEDFRAETIELRPELAKLYQEWMSAMLALDELAEEQLRWRINRILLEELLPIDIALTVHPASPISLRAAWNEIHVYTWNNRDCCLSAGSVEATLLDQWIDGPLGNDWKLNATSRRALERLSPGDVLIFEQVRDPNMPEGAALPRARCHAVRLTRVEFDIDELANFTPVVRVAWHPYDALPTTFPISALGPAPVCEWVHNLSVVRANVILADHGEWIEDEELGNVKREKAPLQCEGEGLPSGQPLVAQTFRPSLRNGSLTYREQLMPHTSALKCMRQNPRQALPHLTLSAHTEGTSVLDRANRQVLVRADDSASSRELCRRLSKNIGRPIHSGEMLLPGELVADLVRDDWTPALDLLDFTANDRKFVVENDDAGVPWIRFGDGQCGKSPTPGETFFANYRIGVGPIGNVPAESIKRAVQRSTRVSLPGIKVRNPLPAMGGEAPESTHTARRMVRGAWRADLQRAITAADYEWLVMKHFSDVVQQARASLTPFGIETLVRIAIDARGFVGRDEPLFQRIAEMLERYRRIGHDIEIDAPNYVSVEVVLKIVIKRGYQKAHVETALRKRLGPGILQNGDPSFFNLDRLSFGQRISVGALTGEARLVTGVADVTVIRVCPYGARPQIDCGALWNNEINEAEPEVQAGFFQVPDDEIPAFGRLQLCFATNDCE